MLNDSIEKTIKKEEENKKKDKNIDIKRNYIFVSLGIRISMIYLFFILVIGKYLAEFLNTNNLFLISIILATFVNVYIIISVIKEK